MLKWGIFLIKMCTEINKKIIRIRFSTSFFVFLIRMTYMLRGDSDVKQKFAKFYY